MTRKGQKMGIVNFNQSGYEGCSMSSRAKSAYDAGEKPKSKWTKKAMLEEIKSFCNDELLEYPHEIEKMKKDDIFSSFFGYSSWHHTGMYANETEFYSLQEDSVEKITRPMSDEKIKAIEHELEQARLKKEKEHEQRRIEREEKKEAFRTSHRGLSREELCEVGLLDDFNDYVKVRIKPLMNSYPELFGEPRPSKSGKSVLIPTKIRKRLDGVERYVNVIKDKSGIKRFECFVYMYDVDEAIRRELHE